MKIKTIIKKNTKKNIFEIVKKLKLGDIISLPTETVYGLAGRSDNETSIRKIFSIKKFATFIFY